MRLIKDKNHCFYTLLALAGMVLLSLSGCLRPDDIDDVPEILDVKLSKSNARGVYDSLFQGDSIKFTISFQDGDGDIGVAPDDSFYCLFIRDLRRDHIDSLYLPMVESFGNFDAIRGDIYVTYLNIFCLNSDGLPDPLGNDTPSKDTVNFAIQIMDRARNISNEFEAPPLFLGCEN